MTLAHNRLRQHIQTADNHRNGIQADIRMSKWAKVDTLQNVTHALVSGKEAQKIHRWPRVQVCCGQQMYGNTLCQVGLL